MSIALAPPPAFTAVLHNDTSTALKPISNVVIHGEVTSEPQIVEPDDLRGDAGYFQLDRGQNEMLVLLAYSTPNPHKKMLLWVRDGEEGVRDAKVRSF